METAARNGLSKEYKEITTFRNVITVGIRPKPTRFQEAVIVLKIISRVSTQNLSLLLV